MKIALIGSGNVAAVLGRLLTRKNHTIVQVVSRNIHHAEILAAEFKCVFSDFNGCKDQNADLYIIALTDAGIEDAVKNIDVENKPVFHTAGSVSKDVLNKMSSNYGVLYPLQTLRKESAEIPSIPFMIDASNEAMLNLIKTIAEELSDHVVIAGDEQRLKIHVAAVVVNNFTNHLFTLAEEYCLSEQLDFDLLKPLIIETAERIKEKSPSMVQTGPAVRHDNVTIENHLALLSRYPQLKSVYLKLTESISNHQS